MDRPPRQRRFPRGFRAFHLQDVGSETWFLAATTSARIEMAISGGVRLPM
jgi:hypothetical protein